MCVTGPLGSALCRFSNIRRVVISGAILCSLSFIMASFADKPWHLYVTFTFAGKVECHPVISVAKAVGV